MTMKVFVVLTKSRILFVSCFAFILLLCCKLQHINLSLLLWDTTQFSLFWLHRFRLNNVLTHGKKHLSKPKHRPMKRKPKSQPQPQTSWTTIRTWIKHFDWSMNLEKWCCVTKETGEMLGPKYQNGGKRQPARRDRFWKSSLQSFFEVIRSEFQANQSRQRCHFQFAVQALNPQGLNYPSLSWHSVTIHWWISGGICLPKVAATSIPGYKLHNHLCTRWLFTIVLWPRETYLLLCEENQDLIRNSNWCRSFLKSSYARSLLAS